MSVQKGSDGTLIVEKKNLSLLYSAGSFRTINALPVGTGFDRSTKLVA